MIVHVFLCVFKLTSHHIPSYVISLGDLRENNSCVLESNIIVVEKML